MPSFSICTHLPCTATWFGKYSVMYFYAYDTQIGTARKARAKFCSHLRIRGFYPASTPSWFSQVGPMLSAYRFSSYLQNPDDLEKLARGFRLLLKIARTKEMDGYIDHSYLDPELDHAAHMKSHDEIREIVRERVETVYHPTSTCRMAPPEQNGVVDAKLRVYGVQGLRVCDASIFPSIISGHTVDFLLDCRASRY